METESATDLRYRNDLQVMTTNVYYGKPGGLNYVSGTYHTFGNNGTTPYYGSVNSGSNTALNNSLAPGSTISATQLCLDLTNASDHLPMVADYTIPLPVPLFTGISTNGTNLFFNVANGITNGVFTVLTSTDLTAPLANWTALTTNVANSDSFTLTATNAVNNNAPEQFYLLKEN